jgi:hypothetical protein
MPHWKFELNDVEKAKARAFEDEHEAKHGRSKAVDGARYTYMFTPSSIGTSVTMVCGCGVECDLTDYESF